jgi:hypothetical protein
MNVAGLTAGFLLAGGALILIGRMFVPKPKPAQRKF